MPVSHRSGFHTSTGLWKMGSSVPNVTERTTKNGSRNRISR